MQGIAQAARSMLSSIGRKIHRVREDREMTRLAMQHNAVNLAQGFPDFAAPAGDYKLESGHGSDRRRR